MAAKKSVEDGFLPSPVWVWGELVHGAAAFEAKVITTRDGRALQVTGSVKNQSAFRSRAISASSEFVNRGLFPNSVFPELSLNTVPQKGALKPLPSVVP